MATHANSTPAPERLLLRHAAAPGRLSPAAQSSPAHQAELLAILDAGPITPAELVFLSQQQRKRAMLSVDALIDLLDALDGDTDLEPDADLEDGSDDELSLGSPEAGSCLVESYGRVVKVGTLNQERWASGSRCQFSSEAEVVDEDSGDINDVPHDDDGQDLEPDTDKEPELGWSEGETLNQGWRWGFHASPIEHGLTRPPKQYLRCTEPPRSAAYRADRHLAILLGRSGPTRPNLIRVIGFVQ